MKSKVFNFLLILSSLLGFLEWGGGNQVFLFQAEAEILQKLFTAPMSVLHPFTVLPLIGQILLLITLFQKQPSKRLTFISIGALSLLLGFMFIIGIISLNIKVLASTLPFLVLAFFAVRYYRSQG
ncbi:MAG: hypothetical protein ACKVTZ_23775 [Bacteroidia bacterium]